jgi:hypothetical protein
MHVQVSSARLDLVPMTLDLMEVLLGGDRERAQRMAAPTRSGPNCSPTVTPSRPARWPQGVSRPALRPSGPATQHPPTGPTRRRFQVLTNPAVNAPAWLGAGKKRRTGARVLPVK